jgi:hypothetical protein
MIIPRCSAQQPLAFASKECGGTVWLSSLTYQCRG